MTGGALEPAPPLGEARWPVWGMTAVLLVTDPAVTNRARALLARELAEVDEACSRFRPDSELMRVNGAAGGPPTTVGKVFAQALAVALEAARLSEGAVDPTVGAALINLGYDQDFAAVQARSDQQGPTPRARRSSVAGAPGWQTVRFDRCRRRVQLPRGVTLDLGATAKAFAADRAAGMITDACGCGVLVGLGGDIAVAGAPPQGGWRVRVTDHHAAAPDAPGQTIAIEAGGLASSSVSGRAWTDRGRRAHHIIDPATGRPAGGPWRTVTVAAATCVDANTAATAAIVRGGPAVDWLAGLGLPARLVARDGRIVHLASWPAAGEQPVAPAPVTAQLAAPVTAQITR